MAYITEAAGIDTGRIRKTMDDGGSIMIFFA